MGRKEQRIKKDLKKIQLKNLIKSKTDILVRCSGSLPTQKIPGIRAISHIQTG